MSEDEMVRHNNYRVVVHPHESKDDQECLQLQEEIERNINDFDFTEIVSDTVCAACGRAWEKPPNCCIEAITRWKRENPEWSTDEHWVWHFHRHYADGKWWMDLSLPECSHGICTTEER